MTAKIKPTTNTNIRVVAIADLQTDPSYQRSIRPKHRSIVADFIPEALGIPLVAEREDGSLWIVDGLQRTTALQKLSKTTVRVEIFHSDGPENEAKIFRTIQANRSKLSSAEVFRAALTEGNPTSWSIKEMVEKCGFKLILSGKGGRTNKLEIACINTLVKVTKQYGLDALEFALTTVSQAWESDPNATYNCIVECLGKFYVDQDRIVDVELLIPRLRTTTPAKLMWSGDLGNWNRVTNMVGELQKLYKKRLNPRRGA